MFRTAAVALLAMALIGCGDVATDHLPSDSPAVMLDPSGSPVSIYVYGRAEPDKESGQRGILIPSGTRVRVLEDDDTHSHSSSNRMVEVRVDEGEHRQAVGFVARSKLRPSSLK